MAIELAENTLSVRGVSVSVPPLLPSPHSLVPSSPTSPLAIPFLIETRRNLQRRRKRKKERARLACVIRMQKDCLICGLAVQCSASTNLRERRASQAHPGTLIPHPLGRVRSTHTQCPAEPKYLPDEVGPAAGVLEPCFTPHRGQTLIATLSSVLLHSCIGSGLSQMNDERKDFKVTKCITARVGYLQMEWGRSVLSGPAHERSRGARGEEHQRRSRRICRTASPRPFPRLGDPSKLPSSLS